MTNYILPRVRPDLSLIWFRNPDSTEHTFGPGSPAYLDALADQDGCWAGLTDRCAPLGLQDRTDVIVVSDHGHTPVAGDPALLPRCASSSGAARRAAGAVGASRPEGLLGLGRHSHRRPAPPAPAFAHVYDGAGCTFDPVLSGIEPPTAPRSTRTQVDADGSVCGKAGARILDAQLRSSPGDAAATDATVIAANGGSDYLYPARATTRAPGERLSRTALQQPQAVRRRLRPPPATAALAGNLAV